MSSQLNLLTTNQPFAANAWNENVNCQTLNIQQQQGVGVIAGMTLSLGTWPQVNVAAGYVQNPRTVQYGGGSFLMTATAGTWYIMADWSNSYNPSTGITTYSFIFSQQSSPTPPSGQVCLGSITTTTSAFVGSPSTAGLVVLPNMTGSQFIVGQNRLVVDDSTGIATVQNMQGNVALKNILVSGDSAVIDANYQVLLFKSLTVPVGATLTVNGELRVIS